MFKEPERIWQKYSKIKEYCTRKNLYSIVARNERFYDGDQWIDVNGKEIKTDMPKPVINVLQRIAKSQISVVSSNDISVSITPFSNGEQDKMTTDAFSKQVEKVFEQAKIVENAKAIVKDAFVDGSAYLLLNFDATVETGQDMKGIIKSMVIPNTRMYFGNPYSNDIQSQPFIIVSLRQHIHSVREEAKRLGIKDIDMIHADNEQDQVNDDSDDLVTVLVTYYKKNGQVFMCKSVRNLFLMDSIPMGYTRYPVSCMGWDEIKNSYLYTTPFTSNITNQIFVNKIYAMMQYMMLMLGMPKTIYDKNKIDIDDFFQNEKQGVVGMDLMGKYLDFIKVPDSSAQMLPLVNDVISKIKESMGSSDASLGDVKPDNTSAIIALQEATNQPLELQRQQYYTFWEDTVRNIIDIMTTDYNTREIIADEEVALLDFSALKNINYELNVDIGSGAKYSEIAQINTADKLFEQQVIDPLTYVEIIPDKYILAKGKIVEYLKQQKEQADAQMMMQQQMAQPPMANTGSNPVL